jgi:ATP-binding cassette subfamily F protein 3
MLNFSNLALRRGPRVLFEQANFSIHRGYKVGITGANGCGKSSLFALLMGKLHSDQGSLDIPPNIAIAHVAQETPAVDQAALDYVLDGDRELRELQRKIVKAEEDEDGMLLAELYVELDSIDGYTAPARAGKILQGLGFKPEQLEHKVTDFSGGWRMRLNLAQALICRSELLLLDEPTNHLDLDAVIWLENWLRDYPNTLLLISHDRDFLDAVTTHILHIENQRLKLYTGNYSDFETRRAEMLAQQQAMFERQQREIAHIQHFIDRFKAKASKAKQAQSRIKTLERVERIAAAHVDSPFHFEFFPPQKLPHPLLHLDEVTLGYGKKIIIENASMSLLPGDRIGLLGHNGAGKSTLIKLLAGELQPINGTFTASPDIRIGYFAQHQLEQLDPKASPLLHLQRMDKRARENDLRTYLGGFGFHGDAALQEVEPFSGGEKARLVLAILCYQRPNLLLLDEPTNHLDLDMRHALTVALQEFTGAMVLVSHDRHLLSSVCDRFLLVDQGEVSAFDGDLDAYRQWLAQSKNVANKVPAPTKSATKAKSVSSKAGGPNPQKLQARLKELESSLASLHAQKAQLDLALSQADIYEPANRERLQHYSRDQASVTQRIDDIELEWLELSGQLESP